MSKNDWYGGYGFVPAKDNYEDMMAKKENLKRAYIKMCASKKKSEDVKKTCNFILEEVNPVEPKTEKEYESKLKSLKKEIIEYKKDINDFKKEITKVKKARFENLNKIESQKNEISDLKNSILRLETLLQEERRENKAIKKELDKQINSFDKKEIKSLKVENQRLLSVNNKLYTRLSIANKQIQNYQLIRNGETDSNIILKYKEQVSQKNNEIDNLKKKLYLTHNVINNLNTRMGNKKRKVVLRKINEYKQSILDTKNVAKEQLDKNIIFGFLSLNKDNEVIFVDINNKKYKVSANNNRQKLYNHIGMPARAVKNEIDVFVDYIYYTVSSSSKSKTTSSNKINMTKEQLDMLRGKKDELKGKKILLIGSKRKGYYCSALSRLGADVIYHESFSDNETRLLSTAPSCDVVLICTSHVSHSIINEIKKLKDFEEKTIKYQMIEKDNIQNLIHRIRYVLENVK